MNALETAIQNYRKELEQNVNFYNEVVHKLQEELDKKKGYLKGYIEKLTELNALAEEYKLDHDYGEI